MCEQLAGQTPLDWTITFTALAYIVLAAKGNNWCWAWGIASAALWAYADFFRYNLWVDGLLQVFYVGMGVFGWYAWRTGGQEHSPLAISNLPARAHGRLIALGLALTLLLGFVFKKWTPTSYPYPDALITAFSVIATWLTARKILESWLYWIVFDALAVWLFWLKDAVLVAVVMVVYTVFAAIGYWNWRREMLSIPK